MINYAMNQPFATLPKLHTMGDALYDYLSIKMHHLILEKNINHVHIIGEYDRKNSVVSKFEKAGKQFNKYRPTAILKNKTLLLKCFPGIDYVDHYASIYATYFKINKQPIKVTFDSPDPEACRTAIRSSNLMDIKGFSTAIIGTVESFSGLLRDSDKFTYIEKGDFQICYTKFPDTILIGCKFSFWGDISGIIVEILGEIGFKRVIYIGKLGALQKNIIPNQTITTGGISLLNGTIVNWKNDFQKIFDEYSNKSSKISFIIGKHVTSKSILRETKEWLNQNEEYDFVDPEIGHMALSAKLNGIHFSYVHIVSNNLSDIYTDNLSNERTKDVQKRRFELLGHVENIIYKALLNERN